MLACEIYSGEQQRTKLLREKRNPVSNCSPPASTLPTVFFQELNAVWLFHTISPCMCQGHNEKGKKDKGKDRD